MSKNPTDKPLSLGVSAEDLRANKGAAVNALAGNTSDLIVSSRQELDALRSERNRLMHDSVMREREWQKHFDDMRQSFSEREASLKQQLDEVLSGIDAREKDLSARRMALDVRRRESDREIEKARQELASQKTELEKLFADYEEKRKQLKEEGNALLKSTTADFVSRLIAQLSTRQTKMERVSLAWSLLAGVSLLGGFVLLGWISYLTYDTVRIEMSWPSVTYYALKGSILLGCAAVLAKYSFVQSSKYMEEALRTTDRIHGMRFGLLFVETYGASASWDEVKAAFENWNGKARQSWLDVPLEEDAQVNFVSALADKVFEKISQKIS